MNGEVCSSVVSKMWYLKHHAFVMRRFYLNGKPVTQTQRDFRIQFYVARHGAIPDRNTILRWIKNVNTARSLMKKPPGQAKTDRMTENVERVRIATVQSRNHSLKRRAESVAISASSTQRDFRIQFYVARHGAIPDRNTILRWIKNVNTARSLMKKPPGQAKTDRMTENVERVRIATVQSRNHSLKRRAESVAISASSILAGSACNLLLMDLSAVVYFSTVIIGRLHDSKGPIVLDDDRASWIGSIHFICQPLGSLASGVLTELMGRKRVMVLLNIPFLVGWVLIWLAPSYEVLLVANVIHGLSMGLVEAPICTYVGEVCEPDIRGIMGTSGGIFYQVGSLFVLLLGTLTDWRTTAGISIAIPILTGICLLFVPEAPIWLVSKGRVTEAQKSLCLLRGWVEPKDIQKEYEELLHFQEKTEQNGVINDGFEDEHNSEIPKENVEIPHKEENYLLYRVKEMWEPVTRRPIILIVVFMFLITWSGHIAARPYMVTVLDKFEMPLRSDWSTSAPKPVLHGTDYPVPIPLSSDEMNKESDTEDIDSDSGAME
ncbi:hypothetical protein C0J52_10065 [Blattella germanica]|nr:hypothetical protein C0J52_10065 [Blattella germanica]